MARAGTNRDYPRDPLDWYIEPSWCHAQLQDSLPFDQLRHCAIWDPACGQGTGPGYWAGQGFTTWASDVVDRGYDVFLRQGPDRQQVPRVANFLGIEQMPSSWAFCVVCNPPYRNDMHLRFMLHAIRLGAERTAVLVPLGFLTGMERATNLFRARLCSAVVVCSRRPSMPPGGQDIEPEGGAALYCWVVADRGRGTYPVPTYWADPKIGGANEHTGRLFEDADGAP